MNEIIKKNGITYGIITGVVSALITTAIYSIDLNLFVKWWIGIVIFLVYIIIGIVLLSKTKKEFFLNFHQNCTFQKNSRKSYIFQMFFLLFLNKNTWQKPQKN